MEHTILLVQMATIYMFSWNILATKEAMPLHFMRNSFDQPCRRHTHTSRSLFERCQCRRIIRDFFSSRMCVFCHIYFRSSIVSFGCGRSGVTDILKNVQRIPQTIGLNAHFELNIYNFGSSR